ncbi:MAG: thioredoxin-like domain-containing protein [Bacteroidota bacterium]
MIVRLILCVLVVFLGACGGAEEQQNGNTSSSVASSPAPKAELPQDKDYEISLTIPNAGVDTIFLAYYLGAKQYLKDTAFNVNGTYTFKGDSALPGGLYLAVIPPNNRYFDFVVNRDQHFSISADTSDFAGSIQISGSEENELFYDHIRFLNTQREQATALQEKMQGLEEGSPERTAIEEELKALNGAVMQERKDLRANYSHMLTPKILTGSDAPEIPEAPEGAADDFAYQYYKAHFFDHVSVDDGRLTRTPIMEQKVEEYLEKLVVQHPDSLIKEVDFIITTSMKDDEAFKYYTSYLLNKYAEKANKIMGMDGVYLHIVEKYYATNHAWWVDPEALEEIIAKAEKLSPIIIGRPGQDFTVPDVNGVNQSVFAVEADLLILYFWDYDCGRCKKVTPQLAELFPKYKDKGVELFTVSINGSDEDWKAKLKEYGLDKSGGIHTADPYRRSGFDQKYNINSTPKIFILDKDKIIRYKWIGIDQLAEILDRELEKKES